jgi:hypothetical protein
MNASIHNTEKSLLTEKANNYSSLKMSEENPNNYSPMKIAEEKQMEIIEE